MAINVYSSNGGDFLLIAAGYHSFNAAKERTAARLPAFDGFPIKFRIVDVKAGRGFEGVANDDTGIVWIPIYRVL